MLVIKVVVAPGLACTMVGVTRGEGASAGRGTLTRLDFTTGVAADVAVPGALAAARLATGFARCANSSRCSGGSAL